MKLLLDQNLSFRLCRALADLYPGSQQVRRLSLDRTDDRLIWSYAGRHDFMLVSQDADLAELAALFGPPPKLIWLRCGNQPTATVEAILRVHIQAIEAFERNPAAACLEIY